VLAALVRKENVVHNVADEIVSVVADLLAGAIVAAGRWGRRLATVVVVAIVEVPVVAASVSAVPVIPATIIPATVVGGLRGLALVPVAQIPGAPVRSPFPGPERDPGRGRDGERQVMPQVRREQGAPPHDLRNMLRTFTWNRRNRHAPAVEKPPRREVGIGPWHGLVARVQAPSHPDGHVHPIVRGTSSGAWRRAIVIFGRQLVARARRLVVVLALAERPPSSCHGLACLYVQRRASAGGLYVEDARPLAAQRGRRCIAWRVDGWRRHPGTASMPTTR
jgi:hypothetical protein